MGIKEGSNPSGGTMWYSASVLAEIASFPQKRRILIKKRNHLREYSPSFGEMGTVISQYKHAMLKHSKWYNEGLFSHFYKNENGLLLKYGHSYMGISSIYKSKGHILRVFSHFMPYSMREGLEMLKCIFNSEDIAVFAVTPYLGKQLSKIGFTKIGETPQFFGGEVVLKEVFVNKHLSTETIKAFMEEAISTSASYSY